MARLSYIPFLVLLAVFRACGGRIRTDDLLVTSQAGTTGLPYAAKLMTGLEPAIIQGENLVARATSRS